MSSAPSCDPQTEGAVQKRGVLTRAMSRARIQEGDELGRKGKESLPLKHPMVTRSRVKRQDRVRRIGIAFRVNLPRLETRITKELVLGGGKGRQTARPVSIDNQEVEIVNSYKYLGTLIDQNLIFCDHVDLVYKKAQQRLFLLRRLIRFEVHQNIF